MSLAFSFSDLRRDAKVLRLTRTESVALFLYRVTRRRFPVFFRLSGYAKRF